MEDLGIRKITIRGELTDLNTFIKANNASHFMSNSIKRKETTRVANEALYQRTEPVDEYPVFITYHWYNQNARKDIDNISFAKKFINDGLVEAGVLDDDSRKYIAGFREEFYIDEDRPRVEVIIHTSTFAQKDIRE